mgnify:CR=1 FL=1|tara:strand:- start:109 stop:285 length:177 start_codon:yes stop_codon:yes gene_type:complete
MTIQIIVYITTENDIVDEEQVDQDLRDAVSQAVKDVIAPSLQDDGVEVQDTTIGVLIT